MSWKRTPATVYVVAWPDGVFKVGVSERQRWRAFVLRGASVLYLAPHCEAYAIEARIHAHLRRAARRAFSDRTEAVEHLGSGGGGWVECYRALLPSIAPSSAPASSTYARTNGLTKSLQPSADILTFRNARTRIRRFDEES